MYNTSSATGPPDGLFVRYKSEDGKISDSAPGGGRTSHVLNRIADIIAGQVEEITRAWVADLRQTPATEIHNTLLSYQIVSGVKAMLGALAQSIRERQVPDAATARLLATLTDDPAQVVPEASLGAPLPPPPSGRYPAL